jgi:MFS-type transporter involved in bile tolerance (Atg22 family)
MLGPLIFGLISSSLGSQRIAMLSTGVFFLVGLWGMRKIDAQRGQAEAAAWEASEQA